MWKETIICIIIVITIITGNIITQNYTKESVKKLTDELEELKIKISEVKEDKEKIENKSIEEIDSIKKYWEERHEKLAYYIEHDELEKVDTALTQIKSFVETKEYPDAISELDKSVFVLKHIKEKYEFNLENVF